MLSALKDPAVKKGELCRIFFVGLEDSLPKVKPWFPSLESMLLSVCLG